MSQLRHFLYFVSSFDKAFYMQTFSKSRPQRFRKANPPFAKSQGLFLESSGASEHTNKHQMLVTHGTEVSSGVSDETAALVAN